MRTLQKIFDAVIDAGWYTEDGARVGYDMYSTEFMCNSLNTAERAGVVTEAEVQKAHLSIANYMASVTGRPAVEFTMGTCIAWLKNNTEDNAPFSERLAIYRDWANRPRWHRKMWLYK